MDLIRNWAFSVAIVVIFGTFSEAVMPNNEYRKYIHIVLGLLLIITISRPFISLFQSGNELNNFLDNYADQMESSVYIQRNNIEQKQEEDVMKMYTSTLSNNIKIRIESKVPQLQGKINVKAMVTDNGTYFGEIDEIFVSGQIDSEVQREVKEIVSDITGISESRVKIILQ